MPRRVLFHEVFLKKKSSEKYKNCGFLSLQRWIDLLYGAGTSHGS